MRKNILVMVLLLGVALPFASTSRGAEIECCCDIVCIFELGGNQTYNGCQTFQNEGAIQCNEEIICKTQFWWLALFYKSHTGVCDINLTDDRSIDFLLDADDPRLDLLRQFRDEVLSQTPEGQELIDLYYELSPALVQAMQEDEAFKEYVQETLDGILPLTE